MTEHRSAAPVQPAPAELNPSARQGFALAGALLALVVVGALVTGSFYAASQESAIGMSSKLSDEAMYVAENALTQANAATSTDALKAMTTPMSLGNYVVTAGGETIGNADVWVRPVGPAGGFYLFVARATATRGGRYGGGTRVLGLMTHLVNINFPEDRAMQVYGGMTIQGSALVSGQDFVPSGAQWDSCSVEPSTQASIVAKESDLILPQKSSSIQGPIVEDATMDQTDFTLFGDMNLQQLESLATKKYGIIDGVNYGMPSSASIEPVGTATTCNLSIKDNWGEPGTTVQGCRDYFPIIFVNGDLDLAANGRGQGILIVDGSVSIHGGFEFFGITIITGSLNTYGNGGHLNGTVLTWNTGSLTYDPNLAIGNSLVQLSGCSVRRAKRAIPGANRSVPVRGHSWIDFSGSDAGF